MERELLRLECLKLAAGRDLTETLERARTFEKYVIGETEKKPSEEKSSKKKNGNTDPLG